MSREQQRQQAQVAFLASGQELEVGRAAACPLPPEVLAEVEGGEPFVVEAFRGGLTARVFRLRAGGRDWTLKRARVPCLVQNVDGQTSFLNEVQRRADFTALKATPEGARRFAGIVDTQYASLRQGLLLSPWIEGHTVAEWDTRQLEQLFEQLTHLLLEGFFEWDLCPGNILDDTAARQVRLFDFGYMYRFDSLRELNPNGLEAPLFHGVERFETRNYFAYLLRLEQEAGLAVALRAFRREKELALATYERLLATLRVRGATETVLAWLEGFVTRWRAALRGDLAALYLAEGWRSHRLDLNDDLHGQTCTPRTLQRTDWLLRAVRDHFTDLTSLGAFFWQDAGPSAADLTRTLEAARARAATLQVQG